MDHWSNQPMIQWSNGPMDRTLTQCSIAISRLNGIGIGYIMSSGIGFFLYWWTFAGLPPGSQKYYRVQNSPKIPIKCTWKIQSFWQIIGKKTDTQDCEFQQYYGSCIKTYLYNRWVKKQCIAKLYSLYVTFDSLQTVLLQWYLSVVLGIWHLFNDLNAYTCPVFYWYHIATQFSWSLRFTLAGFKPKNVILENYR